MNPTPATKADALLKALDDYDGAVRVASELRLAAFKREAEALLISLPSDENLNSALVHIAALTRNAETTREAVRAGTARLGGLPGAPFSVNAASALFSVGAFDESEAILRRLLNELPHDTDLAQFTFGWAGLLLMPRLAKQALEVRIRANVAGARAAGLKDLEETVQYMDEMGISDHDASRVVRPLLCAIARRTHRLYSSEWSFSTDTEPSGARSLRQLLYPHIDECEVNEVLSEYHTAIGESDIPWELLTMVSTDIYGLAEANGHLAA